mgnify:CR=1 FL=1
MKLYKPFYPIYMIIALILQLLAQCKNYLYKIKILKPYKITTPIISIGNIEYGGTGKTPFVYYLSQKLISMGLKPGIVSRGYQRISNKEFIISNENINSISVRDVGDEPFMLSKMLPNVPISINNNKTKGAINLDNNYNLDVIILDDGFQYRKLYRDIDLVLIKNINNKIYLREWKNNLNRADIIATYSSSDIKQYSKNKKQSISLNTDFIINKKVVNKSISTITEGDYKFFDQCVGVCGIANPQSFRDAINNYKTNINMIELLAFEDHQNYTNKEIQKIQKILRKLNCNTIITTDKDIYKLLQTELVNLDVEIFILSMSININNDAILIDMINKIIK